MPRRLLISFLAVLLLAWSGCGTPPLEPKGTVSVALDGEKQRGALTASLLDEVHLTLPPVTEPGYVWEVFLLDHRFVKITTPLSAPDAAGVQSIKFLTIRIGRTAARFLLVKENARESDPIKAQEILLTIQG